MHSVLDARGQRVVLAQPPRRIVSLVPSTTETLHDLGLGDALVGCTRFCVHPADARERLAVVGGTKAVRMDAIAALEPDLIVANEEENKPTMWPELEAIAPLYVAFPRTVDEALDDTRRLAELTSVTPAAESLCERVAASRARIAASGVSFRYAYMIWRDPWMTVNEKTFIASLLSELGGVNVFSSHSERYPSITLDELNTASPDVIFFSSEPYDFEVAHAEDLGVLADRMRMIDGELVSWHGSRMALAFDKLSAARDTWGVC